MLIRLGQLATGKTTFAAKPGASADSTSLHAVQLVIETGLEFDKDIKSLLQTSITV